MTLQFFYLLLLIGKHINPDYQKVDLDVHGLHARLDILDAIKTHLTTETIIDRIIATKLDIKSIYENPTLAALRSVSDLLTLPSKLAVKSIYGDREVTLTETSVFGAIAPTYASSDETTGYVPGYMASAMCSNSSGYTIPVLLGFVDNCPSSPTYRDLFAVSSRWSD